MILRFWKRKKVRKKHGKKSERTSSLFRIWVQKCGNKKKKPREKVHKTIGRPRVKFFDFIGFVLLRLISIGVGQQIFFYASRFIYHTIINDLKCHIRTSNSGRASTNTNPPVDMYGEFTIYFKITPRFLSIAFQKSDSGTMAPCHCLGITWMRLF